MQSIINGKQEVTVTDIKMPFWSMVAFIIKWTIAAIPAMIILFIIGTVIFAVFSTFVTALLHNLPSGVR